MSEHENSQPEDQTEDAQVDELSDDELENVAGGWGGDDESGG